MSEAHSSVPGRTVQPGGLWRNWSLLPRTLPYVRPYARQCVLSVVLTVLLALAAIAAPWPLAFVVDTVMHQGKAPSWLAGLVGDGDVRRILFGALGILIVSLVSGTLLVIHEYVTTNLDLHIVFRLRSDLYRHALRLSPNYYDDRNIAGLMYRINNEADSLGKIVLFFPELARNGLTVAGMVYVAARIDPQLALLGLAVLPLVAASTMFYANRIEPHVRRTRRLELATLGIVHDAISMVRVIVAFGRENHEHTRFREQGDEAV